MADISTTLDRAPAKLAAFVKDTASKTGKSRRAVERNAAPVHVSAVALARHLDVSRTYIQKLEAEGVLHREGDGFPLDASRISYLRFLRRERQQSPRGEADIAFQRAKAELIQLRINEKQRDLIPIDEAIEVTEKIVGIVLTYMSGMAARCGGHDLQVRRRIEEVVFQVRTEISEAASKLADERGEPEPVED